MCGLHMELVLCDFIPELILTQYIDTSTCPGTRVRDDGIHDIPIFLFTSLAYIVLYVIHCFKWLYYFSYFST